MKFVTNEHIFYENPFIIFTELIHRLKRGDWVDIFPVVVSFGFQLLDHGATPSLLLTNWNIPDRLLTQSPHSSHSQFQQLQSQSLLSQVINYKTEIIIFLFVILIVKTNIFTIEIVLSFYSQS